MEGFVLLLIVTIVVSILKKPKKRKYNKYKKNTKKSSIWNNYKKKNSSYNYNNFKNGITKKAKKHTLSRKERKEKGDFYEKYVSNYYKEQGYITYEHGLEKGYKDQGIDLFIKKDKEYLFIQCKNWEKRTINKKIIIEYREKSRQYMINNPKISKIIINNGYKIKLIMVTPKDCYTEDAKRYVKENQEVVNYQIIPIENINNGKFNLK